MSKRIVRHLFLSICAVVLFCCPVMSASNAGPASRSATTRSVTPSDAQIQATITSKLAKSKIGRDGFKFHVQRGIVTWEGTTNVMQHKGSATRMARTAGALQVVNNIKVSGAAKERAAANLKKAQVSD